MKFIISENKREQAAFHWLNKNYGDLEVRLNDLYPDYIFFLKDGVVMIDYFKKQNLVFIEEIIWSFLFKVFSLEAIQIQEIIKKWIEMRYNLEVDKVKLTPPGFSSVWKNLF